MTPAARRRRRPRPALAVPAPSRRRPHLASRVPSAGVRGHWPAGCSRLIRRRQSRRRWSSRRKCSSATRRRSRSGRKARSRATPVRARPSRPRRRADTGSHPRRGTAGAGAGGEPARRAAPGALCGREVPHPGGAARFAPAGANSTAGAIGSRRLQFRSGRPPRRFPPVEGPLFTLLEVGLRQAAAREGYVLCVPESAVIDTGTRQVVYRRDDAGHVRRGRGSPGPAVWRSSTRSAPAWNSGQRVATAGRGPARRRDAAEPERRGELLRRRAAHSNGDAPPAGPVQLRQRSDDRATHRRGRSSAR